MGGGPSGVEPTVTSIYDVSFKSITHQEVKLEVYRGKVLLIVNIATHCGFTPQLAGLQELYSKYKDRGFEVLGFPSNDFFKQSPGTDEEIQQFCDTRYRATFLMFEKIVVKGEGQHELYAFLTSPRTNPKFSGKIGWNFNKFLIGRDGSILNRFGSRVRPTSKEVDEAVNSALGSPSSSE
jgi:glutathione peroxidase